ncbi:MAG: 1-acyl-sn-glycerol-3-phosphate acyltransferase [Bacteroidaceae bacterium]|nr:1-acyl-sn-glycerol-3-phosphate acyltransferase [Bacteroidaceae bacterium]
MIKGLSKRILTKWMGFKINVTIPHPEKYIIALAPHTSNWDFIIGILYSRAMGFKCDFMMKKSWFFWPLGYIMKGLGGIPVERNKKMSLTDQLAKVAKSRKTFHLCITPEGTRKRVTEWKKGFYYIALKAEIPILLYAIDYKKKLIECTKMITPNGNFDEQIAEIKEYFRYTIGKIPKNFAI